MKPNNNTNSFTIAHYILLFLVVGLCIGIAAWIMISSRTATPKNNVEPVVHISNTDPCSRQTMNAIAQMWAYDPGMVPQKYWDMAAEYANEQIVTRIHGNCNSVNFTCRPGQIRRDCDPCAIGTGRQIAMDQHIADTIRQNCDTQSE